MSQTSTTHMLLYEYVGDIARRRGPYRDDHLQRIRAEQSAGRVIMAGALGDPPRGGAIVFRDTDPEAIEAFAREDPYMKAGLITSWRVEPWTLV